MLHCILYNVCLKHCFLKENLQVKNKNVPLWFGRVPGLPSLQYARQRTFNVGTSWLDWRPNIRVGSALLSEWSAKQNPHSWRAYHVPMWRSAMHCGVIAGSTYQSVIRIDRYNTPTWSGNKPIGGHVCPGTAETDKNPTCSVRGHPQLISLLSKP